LILQGMPVYRLITDASNHDLSIPTNVLPLIWIAIDILAADDELPLYYKPDQSDSTPLGQRHRMNACDCRAISTAFWGSGRWVRTP